MKPKYFLSLFSLIIFFNTALAQRRGYVDSLQQLLVHEQSDTGKLTLLHALTGAYVEIKPDSSLWYAQRYLELAQKIKNINGEISARNYITNAYSLMGNYFKALEAAFQNMELAEKSKDTIRIFYTLREICRTYYRMNDDSMLLEYGRRMKLIVNSNYFKENKDLKFYQFAYANWMGSAFEHLTQIDSALYYKRLSYQIALSIKDVDASGNLAIATNNLGNLYLKTGEDDLAFSFYRMAIPNAEKAGRLVVIANSYLGLAKLFSKKEQTDSALYYGTLSLNIHKQIKYAKGELESTSLLGEVYGKKNTDSAYKYLTMAITLKDSVFNQDNERQVQSFKFNEMLHQRQLEQEKKEAQQHYQNQIKLYSLLTGLIVLIAIAFILYRNNKQKQKANLLLTKQKEKVESTLSELKSTQAQLIQSEKMASLGELTAGIAHEIQNPLNFVNNFSEVNTELIDEMKEELATGNQQLATGNIQLAIGNMQVASEIADDVKQNLEKILHHGKRADAIVKGMLQHSRVSTGQKELTDINKLADEYLHLVYHGMRAKDKTFNATLQTDFDSSIGKINIVPQDIGRVLLNLFNNAFYALSAKASATADGNYQPIISVCTKRVDSKIEIHVKDNGTGIPQNIVDKIFQPFFTTKPTGQGTGLGLSLSYDIIKTHGGEIKVETKEGEGCEFIIALPY